MREIFQADALAWLSRHAPLTGSSIITSLPDYSEFRRLSLGEWKTWFTQAATATMLAGSPEGLVIFYQTDIIYDGEWVDKSYLCQKAADHAGLTLVFHKIVARIAPGYASHGRPGYSHLVGFSREARLNPRVAMADVWPDAGETTWTRGMGLRACQVACEIVRDHTANRRIVDPFCGHGTVLAVANAMGFGATGVDKNAKRAAKARSLQVALDSQGRLSLRRACAPTTPYPLDQNP